MAISRIATPEPEEDLRIRDGCGGRALTNTWDADSNRVGMNANGTSCTFVYDTTAGIPAVIEESSGGTTVYYIREPGGGLIARVHPTEGIRYYHFDELGSARLLTDGTGTVTDRYAYDAYGSLLSRDRYSGSVNQPYQYVGRLGYYTHWMEPDFALLQLGVRFYDVEVGRFASRDPMAIDDVADMCYANDSPTSATDPSGKRCRKVDPTDTGNPIGKCLAKLRRCLPCGLGGAVGRGIGRTNRFLVCDGQNDRDDGYTRCFGGKCAIRIWPVNAGGDSDRLCTTILHEILHAGWWWEAGYDGRKEGGTFHGRIDDTASNAFFYYCTGQKCKPARNDAKEYYHVLGCPGVWNPD